MSPTQALQFFCGSALPEEWPKDLSASAYLAIAVFDGKAYQEKVREIFPEAKTSSELGCPFDQTILLRAFQVGVSHPLAQSLSKVLGIEDSRIRVDAFVVPNDTSFDIPQKLFEILQLSWREPAIENLSRTTLAEWCAKNSKAPALPQRIDTSFDQAQPEHWGLEFTSPELAALAQEASRRGKPWTRCELEVFAQTWSEHCKHKIFAARIESQDCVASHTDGLFKTHIRKPTLDLMAREKNNPRCLSVFHDNAGVLALQSADKGKTDWAVCLKMETHNSPSAISPYGGASTGLVGVHRDILGTGLGAMPIANWNVLCFESPTHTEPRPSTALPSDVIRRGVIRGIEDGGNQSGIPTVQGSVVFDPGFAVKPLVFAGSMGLLPKKFVDKKPRPGLKLYCFGGAVGADGLRGAVMSSRDLRSEDFSGSAVQVANAFVQRRMTDFLLEARDLGLLDVVTDNGAGGLASSVGEMASLSGGATIELKDLRLKFAGLLAWERLLSESQERMTVATSQPEALEQLARDWKIPFDRLGELTDTGHFRAQFDGRTMADIRLEFLHEGCPRLDLKTTWTLANEKTYLETARSKRASGQFPETPDHITRDFLQILESEHLSSREGVARRFDHEVQGRSLRKLFAGSTQKSPSDGSVIEIYENSKSMTSVALAHGLAPWRADIVENTLHSFDEALRSAICAGVRLETSGGLDNFCWPDPIPTPINPRGERHLWRLVKSCETLSELCKAFQLPLISGKDSMKNNSKDFESPATIVVSVGGSTIHPKNIPVPFLIRPNDVVFVLRPLLATLRDSAWERVHGTHEKLFQDNDMPLGLRPVTESTRELSELCRSLKARYQALAALIGDGAIRTIKDVSEGGLLTTLFECCLGRSFGIQLEDSLPNARSLFEEGLGSFVISVDPHLAQRIQAELPEAKRIGVVIRPPLLRWGQGFEIDLAACESRYLKRTREGFWS